MLPQKFSAATTRIVRDPPPAAPAAAPVEVEPEDVAPHAVVTVATPRAATTRIAERQLYTTVPLPLLRPDDANESRYQVARQVGADERSVRALAAPVRLAIVLALAGGERAVHQLVTVVAVSQSLMSQHLRVLRGAGLVEARRAVARSSTV